ncbi:peptidyl-prolyl cis-trans isomerase [Alteromonas sp. SM 2104]|nr:peptidylprolyl isomerase [Alteromonas oceanisediminis]MBT0585340.1 peptidyl-prolyl cis-trans isomerase [Alteromonas oceanisediminis]
MLLSCMSTNAQAEKVDDGSQIQMRNSYPKVQLDTTMGSIVVELDRRKAPITVNNFLRYVDKGLYNNTIFHRVIPEFVVQGGGYNPDFEEKVAFDPIFNESGNGLTNDKYTIAMARQNDPHSATRQFYFNMGENKSLDPGRRWGYAVFGMVIKGSEVLDALSLVETGVSEVSGMRDVPVEPVILEKATILAEE